jgi:hypothetical protein
MIQIHQQIENSSSSSSAEFQCLVLPPGTAGPYLKEKIAKYLEKPLAMVKGKMALEDVMHMHDSGMAQIWMLIEDKETIGCVVTEMVVFVSGAKILKMILCGTDVGATTHGLTETHVMTKSLEQIEAFARSEGCVSVTAEGRRGWGRMLKDYKEVATAFEKVLE